jgi:hypothetical protein
MHAIYLHGKTYPIPSRWDELSARQLVRIAWLSTLKKDSLAKAKLFFFILTSSLPYWKRLRLQYFYLIQASTEERGDFLRLVDSFSESRHFVKQIMPKLWGKTVLLHGPADGLSNASLYEFITAEKYFLNYLANPTKEESEEWLNRLVATLYRQKRSGFDPMVDKDGRIPLTDVGTRYRLRYTAKMPLHTKLAVLMWFDGCRQHIIDRFPLIFPKPKTGKANPLEKVKSAGNPTQAWLQLISELAGGMTNYEAIGNTNLYTALTDISYRIKKNQEQERARAKSKRK